MTLIITKSFLSLTLCIFALITCPVYASVLPTNWLSSLLPDGLAKRSGLAGGLSNLGELIAAVKDYLATKNAYVSTMATSDLCAEDG